MKTPSHPLLYWINTKVKVDVSMYYPSGNSESAASHRSLNLLLFHLEGLLRSHRHDNQSSCRSPFQVKSMCLQPHVSVLCLIFDDVTCASLGGFRHQKEKTGFSFCLESEWVGGQRVEKSGKGLLHVWKRQIQQLNRVSQDMASAILAAYPSPQLLKKVHLKYSIWTNVWWSLLECDYQTIACQSGSLGASHRGWGAGQM